MRYFTYTTGIYQEWKKKQLPEKFEKVSHLWYIWEEFLYFKKEGRASYIDLTVWVLAEKKKKQQKTVEDIHILVPGTCDYVILHCKGIFAGVTMVMNLK